MDLFVRYWDNTFSEVSTRCFMGKVLATDVLEHFDQSCSKIQKQNIQVSSDGPNVNLKFLDLVNGNCANNELPSLISIGTCSLHTLHRAFQHGAQIWSVRKVLQVTSRHCGKRIRRK